MTGESLALLTQRLLKAHLSTLNVLGVEQDFKKVLETFSKQFPKVSAWRSATASASMLWTTTNDARSLRYLVFSGLTPRWTYRVSPSQKLRPKWRSYRRSIQRLICRS